jgi:hypothetical protein
MECERVREEFVERLTGTLDPARDEAIDRHLTGCAACRAETERMREIWSELGSLRAAPAAGGAARIARLVGARANASPVGERGQRASSSAIPRLAIGSLALAASLFMGLVLGRRSASSGDARPTAPAGSAPVAAAVAKERYLLLLHGPARATQAAAGQSLADSVAERAIVDEYRAWAGRLHQSGALVLAEKLADDPLTVLARGGAVDQARNAADEVGGFFLIQAADSAEAYRIAKECPHLKYGGTVQVRRIEPT